MTEESAAPAAATAKSEVSLARLYVLRANYLVWAIAGFFLALPPLINPDPAARGMIDSMFGGLWMMGILGFAIRCKCFQSFSSNSCGRLFG